MSELDGWGLIVLSAVVVAEGAFHGLLSGSFA